MFFFFNDTATTEIYTYGHTLSLHDALPICIAQVIFDGGQRAAQVRSQRAAAEGAFANYKQTVLIALEDVENALSALQAAQQRTGQFTIALDAANNSAILARSQ